MTEARVYKVLCISMYVEDLARLDVLVDELKRRGHSNANRSALIRYALEQIDPSAVPRGFGTRRLPGIVDAPRAPEGTP